MFVCQAAGHVPAPRWAWLWPPSPGFHPTGFSLLLLPQPRSLNPARLWLQFRAGMGFGFVLQSSRCVAPVMLQHEGDTQVMRVWQMSVSQTGCEIQIFNQYDPQTCHMALCFIRTSSDPYEIMNFSRKDPWLWFWIEFTRCSSDPSKALLCYECEILWYQCCKK